MLAGSTDEICSLRDVPAWLDRWASLLICLHHLTFHIQCKLEDGSCETVVGGVTGTLLGNNTKAVTQAIFTDQRLLQLVLPYFIVTDHYRIYKSSWACGFDSKGKQTRQCFFSGYLSPLITFFPLLSYYWNTRSMLIPFLSLSSPFRRHSEISITVIVDRPWMEFNFS